MKRLSSTLLSIILTFTLFMVVGCGTSKQYLDITKYFIDSVSFTATTSAESIDYNLENAFSNKYPNSYTKMVLTGNKKWISGLTLQKVEITFLSNEDCELDCSFQISDLLKSPIYDSVKDRYYTDYPFIISLKANEEKVFTIEVNDKFKDSISPNIILNIDGSIYSSKSALKIAITNFKFSGEHV